MPYTEASQGHADGREVRPRDHDEDGQRLRRPLGNAAGRSCRAAAAAVVVGCGCGDVLARLRHADRLPPRVGADERDQGSRLHDLRAAHRRSALHLQGLQVHDGRADPHREGVQVSPRRADPHREGLQVPHRKSGRGRATSPSAGPKRGPASTRSASTSPSSRPRKSSTRFASPKQRTRTYTVCRYECQPEEKTVNYTVCVPETYTEEVPVTGSPDGLPSRSKCRLAAAVVVAAVAAATEPRDSFAAELIDNFRAGLRGSPAFRFCLPRCQRCWRAGVDSA